VLAAAIVMHGYMTRPAVVDAAAVQAQINQAVTRAVADVERKNADLDTRLTNYYVQSTGIKYQ
jgi:hypothetical protein